MCLPLLQEDMIGLQGIKKKLENYFHTEPAVITGNGLAVTVLVINGINAIKSLSDLRWEAEITTKGRRANSISNYNERETHTLFQYWG